MLPASASDAPVHQPVPSFEFEGPLRQEEEGAHQEVRHNTNLCTRLLKDAVESPYSVYKYYARLSNAFSVQFVLMVAIVYGVNQGIGEALFMVASRYFFTKDLDLDADRYQAIDGFANVPWQMKSIYGIISDTFPIWDLHRTPYIVLAGFLGVFAWSSLWLVPMLTAGLAGVLLLFGNFSVASPDVMIDASVAERCRTHPQYASDLQTLCWSSFGIGKILAASSSGVLYHLIGSRALFGLTSLTSMAILIPALKGWLRETPSSERKNAVNSNPSVSACEKLKRSFRDPLSGPLYRLSFFVLGASVSLGLVAKSVDNDLVIFLVAAFVTVNVSTAVYYLERKISLDLAKASVYIFLSRSVQPSSMLLFYWSNGEEPDNCNGKYGSRPCFSAEFYSVLEVIGYFVFIIGTALYNKYISAWTYKRIWVSTQVLLAVVGLLDLILVMRWNLILGIPDKMFMITDEIIGDLISRLNTMPLFVLAAATCPEGVEATLFAMNMGLSNMGGTIGEYAGLGLMYALGGIRKPEFKNLSWFIVLKSLARLLPLLFIPYLVPDGSPASQAFNDNDVETTNEEDGISQRSDRMTTRASSGAREDEPLI